MRGVQTISVLGSTGSIGTQALEVARARGLRVRGLAAGRNLDLLEAQWREFRPELVSVAPEVYGEAKSRFGGVRLSDDSSEVAVLDVDVTVGAMSGLKGLAPARAALEAGRALALATKEAMVVAGPLIWQAAQAGGGRIVPIDSEHTGVYQLLLGERLEDVAQVILTASGGPFREGPADLRTVTPAQALRHPNWAMGRKITVDSATLFNKGLEVLESAALYGLPLSQVAVTVHPQSVVHALLRLRDGNLKAHLGPTDMRLAILSALDAAPHGMTAPGHIQAGLRGEALPGHLGWPLAGRLDFMEPDPVRFPCLALAYRAGEQGGAALAALNAADEVAVEAFLQGEIGFMDIPRLLESVLDEVEDVPLSWESIEITDAWARARTRELCSLTARPTA